MNYDREQMLEPVYEIKFNGKPIKDDYKRYIIGIEIEEADYEADLARITVLDTDFKFSNYVKLLEKQKAEVKLGYKGKLLIQVKGEVTHIEADFSSNGEPTLIIGIIDNTISMNYKKKTRKWKKIRVSDVAIQIAKEYKMKYSIPKTKTVYDEITQDNETDGELLQKMADDEGLVFYYIENENKLYMGEAIRNPKSIGTLWYNMKTTDIISFQPQLVKKDSPNLVEVKAGEVSSSTAKSYRTTLRAKIDNSSKQSTTQKTLGRPVVNSRE